MSQFFVGVTAGELPPAVPTSFVTDQAVNGVVTEPGLVIPVANQVFVVGNSSEENAANGIVTQAVPNDSENLEITLTNRIQSNNETIDPTQTVQLVNFTLPAQGTYSFNSVISAYNLTDNLGASYTVFVGIRSTSSTAFKLGLEDKVVNEEVGMTTCDVAASVSGNNFILSVTGIAGKAIRWQSLTTYQYMQGT